MDRLARIGGKRGGKQLLDRLHLIDEQRPGIVEDSDGMMNCRDGGTLAAEIFP